MSIETKTPRGTLGMRLVHAAEHVANMVHDLASAIATASAPNKDRVQLTPEHYREAFLEMTGGTAHKLGELFVSSGQLPELKQQIDWDLILRDWGDTYLARARELHERQPGLTTSGLIDGVRGVSFDQVMDSVNRDQKLSVDDIVNEDRTKFTVRDSQETV